MIQVVVVLFKRQTLKGCESTPRLQIARDIDNLNALLKTEAEASEQPLYLLLRFKTQSLKNSAVRELDRQIFRHTHPQTN